MFGRTGEQVLGNAYTLRRATDRRYLPPTQPTLVHLSGSTSASAMTTNADGDGYEVRYKSCPLNILSCYLNKQKCLNPRAPQATSALPKERRAERNHDDKSH